MVARKVHGLEVGGSTPPPATNKASEMEEDQTKYLDKDGVSYLWGKIKDKVEDTIDELPPYETQGGVDTLFDSEVDEEEDCLNFGNGCASYDNATQTLIIEGAVVWDEEDECYMIVVS